MSVREKVTGIDFGVAVGFWGFPKVNNLLKLFEECG